MHLSDFVPGRQRCGLKKPPVALGYDLRRFTAIDFFVGALPPTERRASCFVFAIVSEWGGSIDVFSVNGCQYNLCQQCFTTLYA